MSSYVMFRLPEAAEYSVVRLAADEPEKLYSAGALSGKSGFVFAPFFPSQEHPVLLFATDEISTLPLPPAEMPQAGQTEIVCRDDRRRRYAADFTRFHRELTAGNFAKLVLSRCCEVETAVSLSPENLFMRACHLYPSMFVALISAPESGTWLMATPEILVETAGTEYRTIALAGTMKGKRDAADWSLKNREEQGYVAAYVRECLKDISADITEQGPQTVRAADLLHLRSDFTFRLNDGQTIGSLLEALHPTPAVCGLPKDKARRFILSNESVAREYYSGFAGITGVCGTTQLYVTLRCMQIDGRKCRLYAGGGLLPSSTEQQEWDETEAKMQTMMRCLCAEQNTENDV